MAFRHVGNWSKAAAGSMITRLRLNNWQTPYGVDVDTYSPE